MLNNFLKCFFLLSIHLLQLPDIFDRYCIKPSLQIDKEKGKRKILTKEKIFKAIHITGWYFPVNKNAIHTSLARRSSICISEEKALGALIIPLQRFSPENSSIFRMVWQFSGQWDFVLVCEFIYSQGSWSGDRLMVVLFVPPRQNPSISCHFIAQRIPYLRFPKCN